MREEITGVLSDLGSVSVDIPVPGDSKKNQQNLEPRHFVRSKPSIVKPHKTTYATPILKKLKSTVFENH